MMMRKRTAVSSLTVIVLLAGIERVGAQGIETAMLRGVVVDDSAAQLTGDWKASTHTRPYVGAGYRHDQNADKGNCSAQFAAQVPADGDYHVLLAYTPGPSRATNTPVKVESADGPKTVLVNQREKPALGGFHDLGAFPFTAELGAVVVVSNAGTDGHVIVDAVQLVTPAEFELVQQDAQKKPAPIAKSKPAAKQDETPAPTYVPKFQRPAVEGVSQLTSPQLDAMLVEKLGEVAATPPIPDELFLRRVTLDLVGRQPTVAELEAFLADSSPDKRAAAVENLLASPDYGRNWGNYWSDVIGSRQQEPELTFHDYRPFKGWLAEQLNAGRPWDELVFDVLTASGKVGEHPEGTFIAFHQADPKKLAGETSRVFLSIKIHCAECHDHPFVDMPTETFHGMAAFFARASAKIPWNESRDIELVSKDKGEYKIPGRSENMKPVALRGMEGGAEYDLGLPDLQRRAELANWIVHPENPYFARAFVNRIWARLMGRGFYEPVDDLGDTGGVPILTEVHEALSGHFLAAGYDHKSLARLIVNTQAYQRSLTPPESSADQPLAAAQTKQLRGDEVFDSLATAIALPNIEPEKPKPTPEIRFPIPPKSTRDLVNEAFGYDPSFEDHLLVRSMKQAMFLMNNVQLQKQIDARPESGAFLAKLLESETDDRQAAIHLYRAVFGRSPSENELGVVLAHVARLQDRNAAFEDILWSLINSAEFTTRR